MSNPERKRDRERWWSIHDPEQYVCPDCGRTAQHPEFRGWHVHHLDGVAGNCVAICEQCHQVRHGAERRHVSVEWWKQEFLALGE